MALVWRVFDDKNIGPLPLRAFAHARQEAIAPWAEVRAGAFGRLLPAVLGRAQLARLNAGFTRCCCGDRLFESEEVQRLP